MPKTQARRTFLSIAMTAAERRALDVAARREERPVSAWARRLLLEAARAAHAGTRTA